MKSWPSTVTRWRGPGLLISVLCPSEFLFFNYSWAMRYVADLKRSPEKTIADDVLFLRSFESLRTNMNIVGFVLDVGTGLLRTAMP